MKLWQYFKAEEEGKQIQIDLFGDRPIEWSDTELSEHSIIFLEDWAGKGFLRIAPEPLRLTVMYTKAPHYASGVHVLIKENDKDHRSWEDWTEATFEDGKLIVEVNDE